MQKDLQQFSKKIFTSFTTNVSMDIKILLL